MLTTKEYQVEIIVIWGIISLITLAVILSTFTIDSKTILENTPVCISKSQLDKDCVLCGMTRAFIEISHGNFSNGHQFNKASIFVYCTFLTNSIVFLMYMYKKIKLYHAEKNNK